MPKGTPAEYQEKALEDENQPLRGKGVKRVPTAGKKGNRKKKKRA